LLSVYLLLILVPLAVIAYVVWDHKRKAAARDAVSAQRLQQILGTVERTGTEPDRGVAVSEPTATAGEATLRPTVYARRTRVLDPSHTLVYYLLRTTLPDYVVFAQIPLSSVIEPSPTLTVHARDECVRRLATLTIDFLVSDRNMQPIAVVQLVAAARASAATNGLPERWLGAAGVRCVELDAAALPAKDAIRGVVLGDDAVLPRAQQDATSHPS
jgi:hypothetical protein